MFADKVFRSAGQQGFMQEVPGLFQLGKPARVEDHQIVPLGHARFSYGRGWWDEYWCETENTTVWISVDEGDVAIETPLPADDIPHGFQARLGATVTIASTPYVVTEAENAECIAVRGELPEMLSIGETHLYFDLSGPTGQIVTLEQWEDQSAWFSGHWVDPWQIEAAGS